MDMDMDMDKIRKENAQVEDAIEAIIDEQKGFVFFLDRVEDVCHRKAKRLREDRCKSATSLEDWEDAQGEAEAWERIASKLSKFIRNKMSKV